MDAFSPDGCFQLFLRGRKRADTNVCPQCEIIDDAEHTLFICEKWTDTRDRYRRETGKIFDRDSLSGSMTEGREGWMAAYKTISEIIESKEIEIRSGLLQPTPRAHFEVIRKLSSVNFDRVRRQGFNRCESDTTHSHPGVFLKLPELLKKNHHRHNHYRRRRRHNHRHCHRHHRRHNNHLRYHHIIIITIIIIQTIFQIVNVALCFKALDNEQLQSMGRRGT